MYQAQDRSRLMTLAVAGLLSLYSASLAATPLPAENFTMHIPAAYSAAYLSALPAAIAASADPSAALAQP
ncbi:MAG TPA: hypothetical protein VMD91_07935 [Candidatus Sulfotelmatobacter sp.]|nr:hypothetical protein [Candidatus Sulfotelmatobacter sp.]